MGGGKGESSCRAGAGLDVHTVLRLPKQKKLVLNEALATNQHYNCLGGKGRGAVERGVGFNSSCGSATWFANKKIIQDISCIQLISVTCTTYMCKTEDRELLSSMILIKCQWRTCKVSLTQSQQDLIKPINPYTAAIIQDLWTSTAGKSWWFSNSIYPSLHRDLRL